MTEQELLLTALLNCPRHELYLNPQALTQEQTQKFCEMETRCRGGEPVQYVVGFTEFMGLKFNVDPRVLIPRPETEILVDKILADYLNCHSSESWDPASFKKRHWVPASAGMTTQLKILDLGTGSGNISVSLAKFLPKSRVTALDISPEVLAVAKANAELNGVADRVDFRCGDMRKILQESSQALGFFDMIISNPPYISRDGLTALPENVQREPKLALDGGEDGLDFYRLIVGQAHRFLKPGGLVYLEIGDGQKAAIKDLVLSNGSYQNSESFKDYVGTDRIIKFQIGR